MGTITSATAQHSAHERTSRSEGLFSRVSIMWPAIACSASYASPFPFLPPLSFLAWTSLFPSHLRNIIWFWNKIPSTLSWSLAGDTHALCGSLISIHCFLKCSSIHLERMLWLTRRVERRSLNEHWQRPALWQHNLSYRKWLQNSLSYFFIASTGC